MERSIERVRDPIHGFIHFDKVEKEIINSRPFQRLRNIKQLSFCYYVYPGAMHTRFEHSLGVMELATRVFDHFNDEGHDESGDYKLLKKNCGNTKKGILEKRKLLRLAALLHDVGHAPFSHSGESILGKEHESASAAIIEEKEIGGIIKNNCPNNFIKNIQSILLQEELPAELKFLKQIISGQFDADRMDYLIRDSYHCGVSYGNFDYRRLIETLLLKEDVNTGGLEFAIERGGIHSLEALILARYWMFAQVYMHRTRRIYDIYLEKFLKEWQGIKIEKSKLSDIIKYDDCDVWKAIEMSKNEWAQRIYRRNHHHLIYETGDHAKIGERKQLVSVLDGYKDNKKIKLIFDEKAKTSIHNFYRDKENDDDSGYNFQVKVNKTYRPLYKESEWLKEGPNRFCCYRVYGSGDEKDVEKARKYFFAEMRNG